MTGHFTSYENRTDHELATSIPGDVDDVASESQTTVRFNDAGD